MNTTASGNILIVSNRLPVRITREKGRLEVARSSGGLAAALQAVTGVRTWVGWPGMPIEPTRRDDVRERLAERGLTPVFLTADEERQHYVGMCNGTLWPLLHYYPSRIEFEERAWPTYRAVNERFAAAVAEMLPPGGVAWVHDFHLMLVPQLLRERRPDARIGFFLHVPFPTQELWRLLPQRAELLHGLLGADHVGFHTADYLHHFRNSCLRTLGIEAGADEIVAEGRRTGLGVHALGADTASFTALLQGEQVPRHLQEFAARWGDRRLILGVERLDYSKGILHKLQAFARLLERTPERVRDTVMLQVLVPSREENESYRSLLREIEREVGRINGRFGQPGCMPLEFVHRSVEPAELAALYRYAAVGLVTPVRDGMNLVAHEFVLCQGHPEPAGSAARGVLVLSEFAGAALSLVRSVLVNPWDISGLAAAIDLALRMPAAERTERGAEMYERALELDSARWAQRFLVRLDQDAQKNQGARPQTIDHAQRDALRARFRAAPARRLFLDYDGTLRELTQQPELAVPEPELLLLLARLAAAPATEVHVVSGRRRRTLGAWLGALPLHLCAEHGGASRPVGGGWTTVQGIDLSWLPRVEELLVDACEHVPGSALERKGFGVAWHYRLAEPGYGSFRARELRTLIDQLLRGQPAETIDGHAVLEVRAKGVHKGAYVQARLADGPPGAFVLVAGDDRTDLDMYRGLPADAVVVHVGGGAPDGALSVRNPGEMRRLLASLLAE